MNRLLLVSALLLASAGVRAETNVCTTISSLPTTISAPGVYCLSSNLTMAAGPTWAIYIQAPDVTLDCNSHSITGPAPVAPPAPALTTNGIILDNSARTTIRNCKINGFQQGIRMGVQGGPANEKPLDAIIEDNKINGSMFAIGGTVRGVSRIRRNQVVNTLGGGISVAARDGIAHVAENFVSVVGDPATVDGTAAGFSSAGSNAWVFAEDNYFAEVVAPPSPMPPPGSELGAVMLFSGNVSLEGNTVSAPSDPAKIGIVNYGVIVVPGTNVMCNDNVIVGYGTNNNPACAPGNNRIY
jgi:hypothetical protein